MTTMRTYGDRCGVARALDVIGERWALLVVRELVLGPKRFSDLRAGLRGVAPDVLSQRLRDSVSLAVLTGTEIQYTGRVSTRSIMSVDVAVGTRLPAYATSLGRVILADLPEDRATELVTDSAPGDVPRRAVPDPERFRAELERVRKDGYALVEGELEQGLRSIAVPVRDRAGRAVAAVNVAMHSSRRTAEACVGDVLPELRATAAGIEADLHVAGRFRRVRTS